MTALQAPQSHKRPAVWSDDQGRVAISASDAESYVVTMDHLTKALRQYAAAEQNMTDLYQGLRTLLNTLGTWIEHQPAVDHGILSMREQRLLFIAVTAEPLFNDTLANALTALDLDLYHHPHLAKALPRMECLELPVGTDFSAFCHPDFCLNYCPQR